MPDRDEGRGAAGVDEHDEAVQGITVESFSSRAAMRTGAQNQTPWQHFDADKLALQVKRIRKTIAALTSPEPCGYWGVTRTPAGTTWVQPPGRKLQCGPCAYAHSDADGHWRPSEQWRSIDAAALLGIPGRRYRLGERVGLLFWHETGLTTPNTERWVTSTVCSCTGGLWRWCRAGHGIVSNATAWVHECHLEVKTPPQADSRDSGLKIGRGVRLNMSSGALRPHLIIVGSRTGRGSW